MKDYPQFIIKLENVWNESKMYRKGLGGPLCNDCHLGNPNEFDKDKAHEGMVSLIIVSKNKLLPLNRTHYPEIKIYNDLPYLFLINNPEIIKTILYHDRDPKNYKFRIDIANKTCGKCHGIIVEQYANSVMGGVKFQSQYITFTNPAPHDCGYWLVNFTAIKEELSVDYSIEQAELNRRVCNQCHASCLDCHYNPRRGKHSFSRVVDAMTCYYGNGRGICHAGAEEFRRGGYYFKGIFTGMEDIHAKNDLRCLDCHNFINHNVLREASCERCHEKIVKDVLMGVHRNLSCEACHIKVLGGYQIVVWGPGYYWDMYTPLTKHKYYGIMNKPLLIKNLKGIWIPVKPVIHFALNINKTLNKTGLKFRLIKGRKFSNDAYIIYGTYNFGNISFIAWLHMDKVSHGYGKARNCLDCHEENSQRIISEWFFNNMHMKNVERFTGRIYIEMNKTGLYLYIKTNSSLYKYKNWYDFAPWLLIREFYSNVTFQIPKLSKYCLPNNCLRCHADNHRTILPKYMRYKNLLLITLITFSIFIYLILFIYRKS